MSARRPSGLAPKPAPGWRLHSTRPRSLQHALNAGEVQAITAQNTTMDLRFPGQWFQLETGLHYNGHRHYDPKTGRYFQPDPLGFVGVSSSQRSRTGQMGRDRAAGRCRGRAPFVSESIEPLLDRRLDEAAHLRAKIRLDQIEPVVEQLRIVGRFMAQTLRHLQIPTTSATAPRAFQGVRRVVSVWYETRCFRKS